MNERRPGHNPGRKPNPQDQDERTAPSAHVSPATQSLLDFFELCEDMGRRPWDIAMLVVLESGPATCEDICTAAVAWAEGRLPDADLPLLLADLVDSALALHLGGCGETGLYAITSDGQRFLDYFDAATRHLTLLEQLLGFGDSCVFHDRLLQLTETQTRVLGHVVHGSTDLQIAAALGMKRRTVESHVQRILRKLGMTSRNALIARLTIESIEL